MRRLHVLSVFLLFFFGVACSAQQEKVRDNSGQSQAVSPQKTQKSSASVPEPSQVPEMNSSPQNAPKEELPLPVPMVANRNIAFGPKECDKKSDGSCYTVDASLMELSGVVASRKQADVYWVHNDEGEPTVYALNRRGVITARVSLPGASNLDWEDISIGPGPTADLSYLYVGDIGDKGKTAGSVFVYRLPEPRLASQPVSPENLSAAAVDRITLNYQESALLDFETLFVDPRDGDLYLIVKGSTKVFKAARDDLNRATQGGTVALTSVLSTGSWALEPSAGAMSPDGDEIVIRNETTAWIYRRGKMQSVAAALSTSPALVLTLGSEFNGEAITYDAKGNDLITVSENTSKDAKTPSPPQPVSYYRRLP